MTTVGFCVAGGPAAEPAAAPAAGGASIVAVAEARTARGAAAAAAAAAGAGAANAAGAAGRDVRGAARGAGADVDGRADEGLARQRTGVWHSTFICDAPQAWLGGGGRMTHPRGKLGAHNAQHCACCVAINTSNSSATSRHLI